MASQGEAIDAAGAVAASGGSGAGKGRAAVRGHGGSAGERGQGRVDRAGGPGSQWQELSVRAPRRLLAIAGRGRGGVALP